MMDKTPVKLTVITDSLPPDPNGVALMAARTSLILAQSMDVAVIGPEGWEPGESTLSYSPVPRTRIGTADFRFSWPPGEGFKGEIARSDAILVHSLGPLGMLALRQARKCQTPTIVFLHNDLPVLLSTYAPSFPALKFILRLVARGLERYALAGADVVVQDRSRKRVDQVVFIPKPCESASFPVPARRVERTPLTIAYHGRLSREKALDVLLRAAARLRNSGVECQIRLIGKGSRVKDLIALSGDLGVPLTHVDWCSSPMQHLEDVAIYVNPSRTETFSMSVLEAMGAGLPVVARSVGAIPHYLSHRCNGMLFENDSELFPLLEELLRDRSLRRKLGVSALESATSRSIFEQVADLLGGIVNEFGRRVVHA